MAFTLEQQAQLNSLQNRYSDAVNAFNAAQQAALDAQNAAQTCQNKRDQKSGGSAKNKACHIDTLSALNSAWSLANEEKAQKAAAMDLAKNALDSYLAQLNKQATIIAQTNAAGLAGDPKFQLEQQALAIQAQLLGSQANSEANAQAAEAKSKEAADAAALEQKKKIQNLIIWGASILGFIILVILAIWIYKKVTSNTSKS